MHVHFFQFKGESYSYLFVCEMESRCVSDYEYEVFLSLPLSQNKRLKLDILGSQLFSFTF